LRKLGISEARSRGVCLRNVKKGDFTLGKREMRELGLREHVFEEFSLRDAKNRGLYLREAMVKGISHHREARTEKVRHQGRKE
jgi:hypothetical protein